MSAEEIAFLESRLRHDDVVFEWGSGASTLWLAKRVRHVVTVEHNLTYATALLGALQLAGVTNVSLIFAPPDGPYIEGTDDDGSEEQFRRYAGALRSVGDATVVIIDGRARVACAEVVWSVGDECDELGLTRRIRSVLLHDCDRAQYSTIWDEGWLRQVARVGNLMELKP